MSLVGEKIADSIPDSVIEYVHKHPHVIYVATLPMLVFAVCNLLNATDLQVRAEMFVAKRLGEMQLVASEALGG